MDKLWNMMEPDLYLLAFDQGNINDLTSEDLVMERIKTLSITMQHAAAHTVTLHSTRARGGPSVGSGGSLPQIGEEGLPSGPRSMTKEDTPTQKEPPNTDDDEALEEPVSKPT